MIKSFLKFLGIAVLALVFGFTIWANRTGKLDPSPYHEKGTLTPITSETTFPAQSIPITCGVEVQKIYDFSVQTETFSADGWVWLIWSPAFQELLTSQGIPVEKILTTINTTQGTSLSLTPDNSRKLPDGRFYQIFRFSGKFFASGLDFRHFPFETLKVPLIFGLDNAALNVARAHLVADTAQSGLGEYTDIPGYVNTGWDLRGMMYQFSAGFGFPVDHPETETRFSRVQMDVVYHTSATSAILQLVMPLFVVMTILLLAPNLTGSLWNVRMAIPPSLLLALIFQAQAYRTKIPQLSYLTFMDQMYSVCFAVALAVFGLFVWTSNQLDKATPDNRPNVVAQINRVDLRFQIGLACALVLLACLAWFFPGRLH
jgi:hypothetical protein